MVTMLSKYWMLRVVKAGPSGSAVCSRFVAGIAGSNSPESMEVRLLCLLCAVFVMPSATCWSLFQGSPTGWLIYIPDNLAA